LDHWHLHLDHWHLHLDHWQLEQCCLEHWQLAQHWLEYWQVEQAWQLLTQMVFQGRQECQWQLGLLQMYTDFAMQKNNRLTTP